MIGVFLTSNLCNDVFAICCSINNNLNVHFTMLPINKHQIIMQKIKNEERKSYDLSLISVTICRVCLTNLQNLQKYPVWRYQALFLLQFDWKPFSTDLWSFKVLPVSTAYGILPAYFPIYGLERWNVAKGKIYAKPDKCFSKIVKKAS